MDEQEAQCAKAPSTDPNQPKYIGPEYSEMYWQWRDRQDADPIEVLADTITHIQEQQLKHNTDSAMHVYGLINKLEVLCDAIDKMVNAHSVSIAEATHQRGSLMDVQEQQQTNQNDLSERLDGVTHMNLKIMESLDGMMSRMTKVENNPGLVRKPSVEAQPFA